MTYIRLLVLCVFLFSCAGVPKDLSDTSGVRNTLATEIARAETHLDTVKVLIGYACSTDAQPPACARAKDAVAVADGMLAETRKALAAEQFWLAADKSEKALTAIAEAVKAAEPLVR